MVASAVVGGNLAEAIRLHNILSERFPGSPAIAQSKLHLTTLYCMQSLPTPMLSTRDAAETTKIFESEPCRRTGMAELRLIVSRGMLESAREIAAGDAVHDAKVAAYRAQQRSERDAYWGSMLGVIAGIVANQVATQASPAYSSGGGYSPTYSGGGGSPQPYSTPSTPSANSGSLNSGGSSESVAHNPANEANSCIVAIDKYGYAANNVSSVMGAVFRNSCPFSIEITWCVVGSDCNPGYSNIMTMMAQSDRGISYDASRAGKINWAACRIGFTRIQGELSRVFQHACK